ncbi:hypothetical protein ABZ807_05550 [Micromonospora sp. NPDC047548]|uniref:hypothetical protein n=1 Tax=Micromonospora sp. NPDC047548 TaxID=3155624 RepID=UPI0033D49A47
MSGDTAGGAPRGTSGEPESKAPAKKGVPKRVKQEPVARAGGYVDRGDGNGWVLEEVE